MDADKYAEENGGELDEEYGKSIFLCKIPSYNVCMSPYKLKKKNIKTKKFKHFKIPFFGHQLPPQSYTTAYKG